MEVIQGKVAVIVRTHAVLPVPHLIDRNMTQTGLSKKHLKEECFIGSLNWKV